MMALRKFSIVRLLPAALVLVGCCALAQAATPAHRPGSGLAHKPSSGLSAKKDPARKDEPPISAPHAMLIDAENGGVLFERDADRLIFPASLAKLMAAEYVFHELKEGRLKLTDEFEVSENAWRKGGAPSHSSTMFAVLHSRVSVDDLLHGMIIQSANDACIVLAEGMAGSEAAFAAKLTQRARAIGLPKSIFANSNGLPDPGTLVTSRELAILARRIILDYPKLYELFGQREFTWNKIRQQNRNPLLPMEIGADGLKTGFTKEAGYGLVGSAVQNGLRLIVVVNGLKSAKERAEEGKKLLEWGYKTFERRPLFAQGQIIGSAKVFGGIEGHVPLAAGGAVQVMMPKNGGDRLVARIVYSGPVPAPVAQGTRIGSLRVWRNDNVILDTPLQAAAPVAKGTLSQRALDAVVELVIGLFRAGAQRL
ncbi:MAG TPA: D-alanyl-D-alanine carboxypeptidase family protein [Pseudolabrys sp.]|nr:D-alanyl-D-alanine carboxypeptidase family protein [Pseudolabrys sp.]